MTANVNNKYIKISTYELFLSNIDNNAIQLEGKKVLIKKGTLAERVVSYNLSNEKLKLIDRIKDFILSIFSKEYRAAKIDLKKLIVKFHADYKNDPYVILYEQRLSEKLKENPPLEKMSEIAKNVKTEVNTYTREEVQALVNNLHAENIKSNVKKEETHKAHEKSTDTPTLAIEKENEKGAELENPENETASAEKEEIQTTQVAKQFHETDLPEKKQLEMKLKNAQEKVEGLKKDIEDFESKHPNQGFFNSLFGSKKTSNDERTPEEKEMDKKTLEEMKLKLEIAEQKQLFAQIALDAFDAEDRKPYDAKINDVHASIEKLTHQLALINS